MVEPVPVRRRHAPQLSKKMQKGRERERFTQIYERIQEIAALFRSTVKILQNSIRNSY